MMKFSLFPVLRHGFSFQKMTKMTKIAIPVINGKLNTHFGHTQEFYVFEIKGNKIVGGNALKPPVHEPGVFPEWLSGIGVTDVIAGGMGHKAISIFNQNKINVFVGVAQKPPKELVEDLIEGILETSDNVCDH